MTSPQPDQQPQDPQYSNPTAAEAALVAALALWLASQAAIPALRLPGRFVDSLVALGISDRAARAAGKMALDVPMTGRSRYGAPAVPGMPQLVDFGFKPGPPPSAARRIASEEPTLRARYILNAARRLTQGLLDGTFIDGLHAEKRNLTAHVQAGKKRAAAAAAVDVVAAKSLGGMMRWSAIMDDRTTPDCAALDGTVFTLDDPPGIPGAEHPACRCTAVAAFGEGVGRTAAA